MIVNSVLGFEAQPAAKREVGTHLPIVLYVQSRIHHGDRNARGYAAGGSVNRELQWSTHWQTLQRVRVSREIDEGVRAIESGVGDVGFVNGSQASAEFYEMLTCRNRSVILKFIVILMVSLGARTAAATDKLCLYANAQGCAQRSLAA